MSKLNEDIIIRYLENRCSEEDFVLINEWMKESDENAGELFRMEEIYQLGKFPFEEENLVVRAERRLGRRLEQENQKKQEVFKLRSVLRYAYVFIIYDAFIDEYCDYQPGLFCVISLFTLISASGIGK